MTMCDDEEVADSMESQFARRLAGNEKKIRDKALKKLKKYMSLRSQRSDGGFNREEMLRIWKGLFYCMWMSDKPLIQEELSENIANLMLDFNNTKTAMLFFDVFLQTMLREWNGIDRLRMSKFYMLVRNVVEVSFKFLKSNDWDVGLIDWTLAVLTNGPISPIRPYSGMHYHFCDIYLEEFAKVACDTITSDLVLKFLDPYCVFITKARDYDLVRKAVEDIFEQLVENSKPALDLLAEEEDNEMTVEIRSHTQLPSYDSSPVASLQVDYGALADRMYSLASEKGVLVKCRKKTFSMVGKFRELAEGRLPLDDVPDAEYSSEDEFEMLGNRLTDKLVKTEDEQYVQNIREKKRKKKTVPASQEEAAPTEDADEDHIDNEKVHSDDDLEPPMPKQKKRKVSKKKKKLPIENPTASAMVSPVAQSTSLVQDDGDIGPDSPTNDRDVIKANMPDLIQDLAKPTVMINPKVEKDKFTHLKEWLGTGKSDSSQLKKGNSEVTEDSEPIVKSTKKKKTKKPLKTGKALTGTKNDDEDVTDAPIRKKRKLKAANVQADDSQSNDAACMNQSETKSNSQSNEDIVKITVKKVKRKKAAVPPKNEVQEVAVDVAKKVFVPADTAFVNLAVKKLKQSSEKKRLAAIKKRPEPVKCHSPKRVAFEMSRTQVQQFRKTDKAMACSPSPSTVAFDPTKRPNFGLLKTTKVKKSMKRKKASDFFDNLDL